MKRWTFTILLFLLLVSGGAVVNVAVAWGLALWSEQDKFEPRIDLPVPRAWPAYLEGCNWPPPSRACRLTGVGPGVTTIVIGGGPSGATWTDAEDLPELPRVSIDCFRFGLPMRALEWRLHGVGGVPSAQAGAMLDEAYDAAGLRRGLKYPQFIPVRETLLFRRLPATPIWPGFALNTLFYALILWLLIPGPFVLRRVIRLKRGRCPKCGYDLRGKHDAGCPECGWKRQAEMA